MKLELCFPDISHKKSYEHTRTHWESSEVTPTSPGRFFDGNTFEDFLQIVEKDVTNNPYGVNSHIFFAIIDNSIVGAIQIRHHINHDNLKETGGHIGYGVAPKYRKKGYATEMLRLGLLESKDLGLSRVLITCDIDNIGSNKVILKNGGKFDRIGKKGEEVINRYWVDIT